MRILQRSRWSEQPAETDVCAVCGVPRRAAPFAMTHGIVIWLCSVHRAVGYLRRDGGRVVTRRLARAWRSHGVLTRRRAAALAAHRRRVGGGDHGSRSLPGSYAWPQLRGEAERRFAAGEGAAAVIAEIRSRTLTGMRVPSVRTLRRWFAEGRWLSATGAPNHGADRPKRPPPWGAMPRGMRADPIAPWGALIWDLSRWSTREDDFGGWRRRR